MLKTMATWVDGIPPIQQPMRYGNKAFKDWVDKVGRAPLRPLMRPSGSSFAASELARLRRMTSVSSR